MTNDNYRLSVYLMLILTCACLGYAVSDLLVSGTILAVLVVATLALVYSFESRIELSLDMANRVGLGIGVVAIIWLVYQFIDQSSLIYTFPWPASLLPYLGPLLMVLMPAKLVRPKHVGDWWAMHGIGLAGAGLASALAEDATFGLLLAVWAIVAAWSLALFAVHRAAGTLPPAPGDPAVTTEVVVPPSRRLGRSGLRWAAVAVVLALPAFFLTPRSQSNRWQFVRSVLETGYAPENAVNLNQGGTLIANTDLAFQVTVRNADGSPMTNLDPELRWRGKSYQIYSGGVWTRRMETPNLLQLPPFIKDRGPPKPSSGEITINYENPNEAAPVLADPVSWRPGAVVPVWSTEVNGEEDGWVIDRDATVRSFGKPRAYTQILSRRSGADADLGPGFQAAFTITRRDAKAVRTYSPVDEYFEIPKLDQLTTWARDLLARLEASNPKLAGVSSRMQGRQVVPSDYEAVGRAFTEYFRDSGEFVYSTKITRADKDLDAMEEFLTRTKSGHCQRFTSALVLTLRAVGVPAQYVLGFRGWEASPNKPGVYEIRQDRAHAWAEVLVRRPGGTWHWLSLDPTPAGDAAEPPAGSWLDQASGRGKSFFLDFIVGYNPERRQATVTAARAWFTGGGWIWFTTTLGLAGSVLFARLVWQRQQARRFQKLVSSATGVNYYDAFVDMLRAAGRPPAPGETPADFAHAATAFLREAGAPDQVVQVPERIVEAFYAERYARKPLAADVAAELVRAARSIKLRPVQ